MIVEEEVELWDDDGQGREAEFLGRIEIEVLRMSKKCSSREPQGLKGIRYVNHKIAFSALLLSEYAFLSELKMLFSEEK